MKFNETLFILIGIVSGILLYRKMNTTSLSTLIVLSFIGYGVTKNYKNALISSIIITYILVLLNNTTSDIESFKNKVKKEKIKGKNKRKKQDKKNVNSYFGEDDVTDEEVNDEEHFFNSKQSFIENYKALSSSQVNGLNNDTKELIQTQKSLIDTLKNMGPALKDGKNVLDTFKNYFGSDTDIGKIL